VHFSTHDESAAANRLTGCISSRSPNATLAGSSFGASTKFSSQGKCRYIVIPFTVMTIAEQNITAMMK